MMPRASEAGLKSLIPDFQFFSFPGSSFAVAFPRMPVASVLPRNCTFSPSDWAVLAAHWHPVAVAADVTTGPMPARLLDQDLVLYRTDAGITVAADLCAHRGAPLSMGKMRDGLIACAYHGYCYDHTGRCTLVPAHPHGPIPGKLH